jgi:uncharacterized protein YktB (UPF0637 family)
MTAAAFEAKDFAVFEIEGLVPRMKAIQERIQPKFKTLGEALLDEVAMHAGTEMHVHIAKHLRRKTNAPKDTWMAFSPDKRGYKMHPHFQIGLFDDHVFMWLAFIYELPRKKEIAQTFLKHPQKVKKMIPDDFVLSFDHMKKDAVQAGDMKLSEFKQSLERFRDVKKAELLIGRHILPGDPVLEDQDAFVRVAKETFTTLMPLYKQAF